LGLVEAERRSRWFRRASAGLAKDAELLSLDVFDTVLVRACGAPEALYLWLGRRLVSRGLLDCSPESFARVRLRVEGSVWERAGGLDAPVTLGDFYAELVRALRLDPALTDSLIAHELALEEEVLRPAPPAAELLAAASYGGVPVVFVSDTYFPASFVQRQLERHRLWPQGARCFSSSDAEASKESGKLFERVAGERGVDSSRILHIGDNLACDVRAAERAGVRALWLSEGQLNRYEQRLTEARWETSGLAAALAGASRVARMHVKAGDAHAVALRDVAAGVAGPVLIGYVLWLLQRARDLRLTRLYFVARDGQVLAELASALVERLGWDTEIRYLYASRRSVNLASVFDASAAEVEWVVRKAERISLGAALDRLDLKASDIADELAAAGLAGCDESTLVTDDVRAALRAAIGSGPLRDLVLAKARSRREVVTEYLCQEGLFDGTRYGIVDIGGVGSQARALHALCLRGGQDAPRFFFVGLDAHPDPEERRVARDAVWLEDSECYLFDQQREQGIAPFRGLITSVQLFCAADHGTVAGYQRRSRRVEPVLKTHRDEHVAAWGLPLVRETLREFVCHLVLDEELVDLRADLRGALCDVVREFARRPTAEEARAWGAFPFEGSEISSVTVKPLATPYTWSGVARAVISGSALKGSFPELSWNSWHEGATAMSRPLLRDSLRRVERSYVRIRSSRDPWARSLMATARWLRRRSR
jgi:FMN phosphatase YigB (HAD superfamily)